MVERGGGKGLDEGLQETGENGVGGKMKDSRKQVRMRVSGGGGKVTGNR